MNLGARILAKVLEPLGRARADVPVLCACGARMRSIGPRLKTLRTILGSVPWHRAVYRCPACSQSRCPADQALGVQGQAFSPGARRLIANAAANASFGQVAHDLALYAELALDAKSVERIAERIGAQVIDWMDREGSRARLEAAPELAASAARPETAPSGPLHYVSFDGTGIPMRPSELVGVKGRSSDGSARTREAKLGCVFTQTMADELGRPVRDPGSTTYVGGIQDRVAFGHRIHAEAIRCGWRPGRPLVVLTDGAAYNKTIAAEHFPDAVRILDLYHARERLEALLKGLPHTPRSRRLSKTCNDLLDAGRIEKLRVAIVRTLPRSGPRRNAALKALRYFEDNADAMRYADFRARGFFVGSGVIEAGCKTLVGQRLKESGMYWTVDGANAIVALRTCLLSRRFEQFWEDTYLSFVARSYS